jgi:hypothetical protein
MEIRFRSWYPETILGWLVAKFTGSRFSHSSVVVDGIEYESNPGAGVVKHSPRPLKGKESVIIVDSCDVEFLEKQVGKAYDWNGAASFLMWCLPDSLNKWFCSELAYEFGRRSGILCETSRKITPESLRMLAKQSEFDRIKK